MDIIELSKKIETITNDELYKLFKDGFKVFPKNLNLINKLLLGKGYVFYPTYFEVVHTGDGWLENDTFSSGGTGTFRYQDIISIDTLNEGSKGFGYRNGQIKINTHTTGQSGNVGVTNKGIDPFTLFFNPKDGPIVSSIKKVLLHIMENPIQNPNKVDKPKEDTSINKTDTTVSNEKKTEGSVIEKMKELKELLDMGILTDDEFQTKKKELLEKL